MTASFTVYEDFLAYESGVYRHLEGNQIGMHAVVIVGYGTDEESGLDYWLVRNSWNENWGGLDGFFKILRGNDECGIENELSGGTV